MNLNFRAEQTTRQCNRVGTFFEDVQASTRLPPPSEYLRDDLLLHERMGNPWGVGGTHRKNETLVFLGDLRFKRTESVRCCAVGKTPSKILLI